MYTTQYDVSVCVCMLGAPELLDRRFCLAPIDISDNSQTIEQHWRGLPAGPTDDGALFLFA